ARGPWYRWPSGTSLTDDETGLHGQLVLRAAHGLARELLGDTRELEHHAARLDVRDPPLGRALAGTHAGLGGLLGQRTVGVDVDPHLAATLDVTGHRDSRGLDLAVRDVGGLESLDAEVAERDRRATLRGAGAPRVVLLAVLDPARDQHGSGLRSGGLATRGRRLGRGGGGRCLGTRGVAAAATTSRTVAPTTGAARRGGRLLQGELLLGHVALVDPDLDADAAEGRAGLVEPVVDVRAQRVQGHATLAVELAAAHLGATEAARALDTDALGAGALRGLDALAHRATERDTARELLGDALCDELGVDLGVLDLEDVELDLLAGELLELAADAVRLGATATNHDARAGRVDVHADAVAGALDLDLGDSGALEARGHELADRDVLADVVAVALTGLGAVGEPARTVVGGDAQAVPERVDLLSHYRVLSFFSAGATTTVMWLVRFRIRPARPWARGWYRLSVGPSSTNASVITSSPSSNRSFARSALTRALAIALRTTLSTGSLAACGAKLSTVTASAACLPRIRSTTRRAFIGVTRTNRACALASIAVLPSCLWVLGDSRSVSLPGRGLSGDAPYGRPSRGRGRSAWGRTRRACGRPSPR